MRRPHNPLGVITDHYRCYVVGDGERLFPLGQVPKRSPRPRLRAAKDAAIEVREFGGWTLEKLAVFELYLKQYRRVAGSGSYIDGFAGSGSVAIAGSTDERRGSARLAIESGAFRDAWLFEMDERTFADLQTNLGYHYTRRRRRRIHRTRGDFNVAIKEVLESESIPKDKPCFAFLDPNSTELDWATVEALARYKTPADPPRACKVELWILFNTHQAFARLIDRQGQPNYATSPRALVMDRIMGGRDAWWDLYLDGASINRYATRYASRLVEELGYGFAHPQLICDPESGAPQYFMIHASDHRAAWDFMRWAKTQSSYFDNTRPLPGMEQC